MYYYGIDIGGTTIKCGLFCDGKELVKKEEIPTRKENDGTLILQDIADFIFKNNKICNLKKEDIACVGLGVPGAIRDDGVVNKCINLGWGVFNVTSEFENITGIKCVAGNDANMAALGEYWVGSGSKYSSMVFITIGTGVGGGIIIDGKPLNGINGAACEIGHLPIVKEDVGVCNCGKKGCLEQVASATGIVRTGKRLLVKSDIDSSLKKYDDFTSKEIFDEAKAGDELCNEVVDYTALYLGKGLASIAAVVDPEVFVIGGGVSKAGDFLIDRIKKYYKKDVFHPSINTDIVLASLLNDAGMYGCAYLAGCR